MHPSNNQSIAVCVVQDAMLEISIIYNAALGQISVFNVKHFI